MLSELRFEGVLRCSRSAADELEGRERGPLSRRLDDARFPTAFFEERKGAAFQKGYPLAERFRHATGRLPLVGSVLRTARPRRRARSTSWTTTSGTPGSLRAAGASRSRPGSSAKAHVLGGRGPTGSDPLLVPRGVAGSPHG